MVFHAAHSMCAANVESFLRHFPIFMKRSVSICMLLAWPAALSWSNDVPSACRWATAPLSSMDMWASSV